MSILVSTYLLLNFIILFLIGKISYKFNLVDLPNKRKIHNKATAYGWMRTKRYLFIFNNIV